MTTLDLLPHEAERNPIITSRDGRAFADSRNVADFFDKEHRNVLRDIRELLAKEPKLGLLNFEPFKTNDLTGESTSHYEMDRDGFTLLAMGFTGTKALKWKLRYIEAFNTMEAQLRAAQPLPVIDFSNPAILLGAFQHLQSLVGKKDEIIAEQGDRLRKLDRLEGADGSMCLTDAAKTLKMSPQAFIRFAASRDFIYKRAGSASWVGRQQKINAGYLEHRDHQYRDKDGIERVASQVLVTGKGLVRFAEMLEEKVH